LVVIDSVGADLGEPPERSAAALEGIVRQIRRAHADADIVFLYSPLPPGSDPAVVEAVRSAHERIADRYGIARIDADAAARAAGADVRDALYGAEGGMTKAGHMFVCDSLAPFVTACKVSIPEQPVSYELPEPVCASPLEKGRLVTYEHADLEEGWLGWQESPVERFFHVAVCDRPGPVVTLRFRGDTVGLYDVFGPDSGNVEFSLDGGEWIRRDVFPAEEPPEEYRAHAVLLAEGLDAEVDHSLRLRVAAAVPAGSDGRMCRLAFFLVNGQEIYENPYQGMTPLERIDAIYATMEPIDYTPPEKRCEHIPQSMAKLRDGKPLTIVMLGDSIVNDTAGSDFEHLLMRLYPGSDVRKIRAVRGSTGCWWYREDNRVDEYVLKHEPDLVVIGGISQRGDIAAIRDVIGQIRAARPGTEFMLMTGAFGFTDPRKEAEWIQVATPDTEGYRGDLLRLANEVNAEFLDLRGAWGAYIRASKHAMGAFKRDRVHANDRGKQILGRIVAAYFAPGR
jgi:lysophospholipase L1-like esterase